LIPFPHHLTQIELELMLLNAWLPDPINWTEKTGAETKAVIDPACESIDATDFNVQGIRNTGLSLSGHVADALQWLRDVLEQEGVNQLFDELGYLLGRHINQQFKRVKTKARGKQRFYPVERLSKMG